jgi:AAA+ ATPase superfamily predicted ATPase
MFDRETEWDALTRFVTDQTPGATVGVVSGRRRQGKSFLLESLCEASDGFYFMATEATEAESLRRFGEELAAHTGAIGPLSYPTWDTAIDALLALSQSMAVPVVIDEFPYLCSSAPALPSIIQKAYGSRRSERVNSKTRLLLCGSAVSFMGRLLSGQAPLRGRAGIDLTVPSFDYRQAAEFWGISDPRLAVQLNAVVGGTPAYRREYVRDDAPSSSHDFDAWVARTVLNPSCPLFKEARYLLAEEPDLRDRALYHSVLAAVAAGHTTRGAIATYVGRPADTLRHPLTVLEDAGFLLRVSDVFRGGRSYFQIAEPLVTFYHAIMRPEWALLERPGNAASVWNRSRGRFSATVLGPHFEHVARAWVRHYAATTTLGGHATQVEAGIVNDAKNRQSHQVDVAVLQTTPGGQRRLLAIGEAKWGERIGLKHIARLEHIREILRNRTDIQAADTKLLAISAAGFTPELEAVSGAGDTVLVSCERLYTGS